MKIIEFDDKGRRVESEPGSAPRKASTSALAPRPTFGKPKDTPVRRSRNSSGIELHMFQTGTLRTKLKYIKMNQGDGDFEIPVPWFLIKHPQGNVVIDGGNAVEAAIDKRGHWGAVVDAYDPVMDVSENCVDQCRSVGVEPHSVRFVVQSHLHLDHTGAIGRFPRRSTSSRGPNTTTRSIPTGSRRRLYPRRFRPAGHRLEVPRRRIHRQLRSVRRRHDADDLHAGAFARSPVLPGHAAEDRTGPADDRCRLHAGPLGRQGAARARRLLRRGRRLRRQAAQDRRAHQCHGGDRPRPEELGELRKAPYDFYD